MATPGMAVFAGTGHYRELYELAVGQSGGYSEKTGKRYI
jgi:hypothetical protein